MTILSLISAIRCSIARGGLNPSGNVATVLQSRTILTSWPVLILVERDLAGADQRGFSADLDRDLEQPLLIAGIVDADLLQQPLQALVRTRRGAGVGFWALAVIDRTPAVAAVSRPATTQPMMALVIFALPFQLRVGQGHPWLTSPPWRTARAGGPARPPVPPRARSAPARPVPARDRTGTRTSGSSSPAKE